MKGSLSFIRGCVVAATVMMAPATAMATNCCSINGGTCNIIPPLTHGQNGWTGAICGTTISGTNCTALLDQDASASSGDCITVDKSVTLDLNGKTINCTSGNCGYAVKNIDSGSAANAVTIKNGDITGCWQIGIGETGGTNTSVTDVLVDLSGSCTTSGGSTGISSIKGTIDHVVVKNAGYIGIVLGPGKDLKSVIVRNCGARYAYFGSGYGIMASSSGYSQSSFDNILLIGNRENFARYVFPLPALQRSELQEPGDCNCIGNVGGQDVCVTDINDCFDISNSTTPTFVDDAMIP